MHQVLRRALKLEEEAEKGRAELAAVLEKAAPGDRQACAAAENACAVETLALTLSHEKVFIIYLSFRKSLARDRCFDLILIFFFFLAVVEEKQKKKQEK